MDIGNDSYFKCPSCKNKMWRTNWISYHVSGGRVFSDGFHTGYPHFTHNLAKCPHCGALSFLHNLKETEIERYSKADLREDKTEKKKLEDPELKDLINADKQGVAKTSKEEIELRTTIWKKLNDKCRRGDYELTKRETAVWEKNCKALIPLLMQKLNDLKNDKKEVDPDDEDYLNLLITIAELHRNIGKFEECMKIMKALPKSYGWLTRQFAKQCKACERMVFIVKPQREKKTDSSELIPLNRIRQEV